MRKLTIGDLVCLSCFGGTGPITDRASARLSGIVTELADSNVYEPAEAQVYFGCLESFEWYPIRALSLLPDEER